MNLKTIMRMNMTKKLFNKQILFRITQVKAILSLTQVPKALSFTSIRVLIRTQQNWLLTKLWCKHHLTTIVNCRGHMEISSKTLSTQLKWYWQLISSQTILTMICMLITVIAWVKQEAMEPHLSVLMEEILDKESYLSLLWEQETLE